MIERRSAEGQLDRLPALMQEVVDLGVHVIVTAGAGAVPASQATSTIPIVALIDSPEISGLTAGLARPSRNITGVTGGAGPGLHAKRLQLLKQAAPAMSRVAALDFKYVDARVTPGTHARRIELQEAARTLGLALMYVGAETVEDLASALEAIAAQRADGLIDVAAVWSLRRQIIDFAAGRRLPAVYVDRGYVEPGGLMAYSASWVRLWRRMAEMTDRILRGAKPADLPFEQPTRFEQLVINARTARALGLALPNALLLRADEVIT